MMIFQSMAAPLLSSILKKTKSSNEYYSKKIKKSHIQLFLNLALKGTLKTRKTGFRAPNLLLVHLALRQEGTL